jgi:hypothetical protein
MALWRHIASQHGLSVVVVVVVHFALVLWTKTQLRLPFWMIMDLNEV